MERAKVEQAESYIHGACSLEYGENPQSRTCNKCCANREGKRGAMPGVHRVHWQSQGAISKSGYTLGIIVLWTLLSCVLATDHPPVFTVQPTSVIVRESSKVVLRCDTENSATIEWLINGEKIPSAGLTDVEIQDGRIMIIPSFRRSRAGFIGNDGVYRCIAKNQAGSIISREARVDPTYTGEFYEGFKDMFINVNEGNVAFIPCAPPSGKPQPIITFELNGTEIDLDNARHTVLPSGNLQILDVHRRHSGRYRCIATNPLTNERRRATNVVHLAVKAPMTNQAPVFRWVPPTQGSVEQGANLTLECVVEGAPVPVISWSKYGGKLPENRHRQHLGNLELYNVNKLDEGTYICSAHNGIGPRQVAVGQVEVLEPPLIQTPPTDQIVAVGGNFTVECSGRGQPDVSTIWFHDGQELLVSTGRVELMGTSLTINPVRTNDAGSYQCFVQNSLGSVSAVAMLTVVKGNSEAANQKAEEAKESDEGMQGIAPDLERNQGHQTPSNSAKTPPVVMATSTLPPSSSGPDILDIATERRNPANPGGDRNGRKNRKNNRNRNRGNQGTAAQSQPAAEGSNLEIIPPSKPQVSKLSDTSVMLEWTMDGEGGLPVTFFKVQYKELFEDSRRRRWRTIDADIPAHVWQFEVSGLKPGSTYRFRIVGIYANNDNMHGPNSKKFTMETENGMGVRAPEMGPVIVEARPTETSIKLKWQYLPEEWTPVTGFNIYYQTYGSTDGYEQQPVIGSHIREAELADLMPNTMYSIRMKGYNSVGESDFSNVVVERTSGGDYPNWLPSEIPTDLLPGSTYPPGVAPSVTMTTTGSVTRRNTDSSNKMLYMILGSVLGALVLFLLLFMGICAWKQRRRAAMLAINDSRNKFHDPSRTIHNHDSIRLKHMNGNGFLLNGLGGPSNGHIPSQSYADGDIMESPASDPAPGLHGNGRLPHAEKRDSEGSFEEVFEQPPPPPPPLVEEDDHRFKGMRTRYDPNTSSFHSVTPTSLDPHLYSNSTHTPPRIHGLSPPHTPVLEDPNSCQGSDTSRSNQGSWKVRDPTLTDHIPRSHERLPLYHKGDSFGRGTRGNHGSMQEGGSSRASPLVTAKCNHRRRKPEDDSLGEHSLEECIPLNEPRHYSNRPVPPVPINDTRYLDLPYPESHHSNQSCDATDYEVIDEDEDDDVLHESQPLQTPYSRHSPQFARGELTIGDIEEYSDDDNEAVPDLSPTPSPPQLPRIPRINDYPVTDVEDE